MIIKFTMTFIIITVITKQPHTLKWKECFLFKTIYHLVKKYDWKAQCGPIDMDGIHTPSIYISSNPLASHAY